MKEYSPSRVGTDSRMKVGRRVICRVLSRMIKFIGNRKEIRPPREILRVEAVKNTDTLST